MLADWTQSLFCLVPYVILTPCWCRPQRWRDFLRPCAHAHRNARWLASLSVLLHALSYPLMLMMTATLARNNKCALFFANTKLILIFKKNIKKTKVWINILIFDSKIYKITIKSAPSLFTITETENYWINLLININKCIIMDYDYWVVYLLRYYCDFQNKKKNN